MLCGVGHRCGLDLALLWLWLWQRPTAVALIRPLAWELPHNVCAALKSGKKKERNMLKGGGSAINKNKNKDAGG